jgi:hypothetical protein
MYKSSIITNVIGTGNFITFFATNDFAAGMVASVRDVEPSQYNIFIKEEIQRIKAEDPNVDTKQLMSMAASRWKQHKEKLAN